MKKTNLIGIAPLLILTMAVTVAGCSGMQGTEQVDELVTPDGAVIVDTVTMTATVTAINIAKRKVTLKSPDGHKTTFKVDPQAGDLNQLQVGDQVTAQVTEQVAIYIGEGAPPSAMAGSGVALAADGSAAAGVMVDTAQITAQITAINAGKHRVTFLMPDGTSNTVKVGKDVDLSAVTLGEDVTIQVSEGLAMMVQKH